MATKKQITIGIAVASAALATLTPILISVPLFVLAVLLLAWAQIPERTGAFVGRIPGGNYVLTALAKLDSMLSDRN